MQRNNLTLKTLAGAIVVAGALLLPPLAWAIPTLWGIDEDDGELFRIDDYTNAAATFTSYGQLKWDDKGTLRNIGNDIEAFTVRSSGLAYMVLNDNLGALGNDRGPYDIDGPILLRFDMKNASTTQDNLAEVVGVIDVEFDSHIDNITGLDFDPVTGELYALLWDNTADKNSLTDRLLKIDPDNGSVLSNLGLDGVMTGEDMVFHENGRLLVVDEDDNDVYYVDAANASVTTAFDDDIRGGIGGRSFFEALAWDAVNNNLVTFSDEGDYFAVLTEGSGNNYSLGGVDGLTDVESLAFWEPPPTASRLRSSGTIPEPVPGILIGLGLVALGLGVNRIKSAGRNRDNKS